MWKRRILFYFLFVILFFAYNFYFRPIKGNKLVTEEYKNSSAYINELYKSDEYFKKNILNEENYHIYDEIIDASKNNKHDVIIHCDNCSSKMTGIYEAISLDHPELISFYTIRYKIHYGEIIYENTDNLNVVQSYLGAKRIAREMENIRRDTKDMSDKEKIIYVYDYVAAHNYDHLFTYSMSNQSAYSFFTKRKTVCAGFAKASQIIFQNIGINSYLALSQEHMWNYVEYENKYYVFDATVGACSKKGYPSYYEGLGRTTQDSTKCLFPELYPPIEETTLQELFNL